MKKATKQSSEKNLSMSLEVGMGNPNAEIDALDALLSDLGVPHDDLDVEAVETIEAGELELEAAIGSMINDAADDEVVEVVADDKGAAKVAAAAAKADAVAAKKAAAAVAKVARDAERAEKKAERAAAKAAKPAPTPRKFYATKVERVTDKLGADLGDNTVLTLSDAALTGDDLAAKQAETLEIIKGSGVKVQNRMTLLLEFVSGKSSKLNEVITRALTLLKAEGNLKTGDKGNFHLNLIAKPYSPAAARAMGNNTIAAMRGFKLIQKNEAGVYVANPESLFLMKANQLLGIS